MSETLTIKHMVCRRCIMAVEQVLRSLGIEPERVVLGQAVVPTPLSADTRQKLVRRLEELGFELLDDGRAALVERIKTAIIELVRNGDEELLARVVLSHYLEEQFATSYDKLNTLFAQVEGKTIHRYFLEQKIELVKELITYNELSLTEISYRLGYSSVHHLSSQFKKITGMTATEFGLLHEKPRRGLDQV